MQPPIPTDWHIQISRRQPEAIALLTQVYHNLFNETIRQGCGNCYQKAYFRVQKYLYLQQQNNPQRHGDVAFPTRKYLLKPDRVLQTNFGGATLTNDNLTDQTAEQLLKTHPGLAKHFDRIPAEEMSDDLVAVEGLEVAVKTSSKAPQIASAQALKKPKRTRITPDNWQSREIGNRNHQRH